MTDPAAIAFLQALDPAPPRVWSLIMTVFGDCVLPRGDAIRLTLLGDILAGLGIENNAVRAATSRLTRDGLLARQRDGRLSVYSLTGHALGLSKAAERVIYAPKAPVAPAGWEVALVTGRTQAARSALLDAGFRQVAPSAFARPTSTRPVSGDGIIVIDVPTGTTELAAAAYPLAEIAAAFERFCDALDAMESLPPASADAALMRRVALVHGFRRIALREPALHPSDSPPHWPGEAARHRFLAAHQALSPGANEILDARIGAPRRPRTDADV